MATYKLPIFETIQTAFDHMHGSKASLWGGFGWCVLISFIFNLPIAFMDASQNASLVPISSALKVVVTFLTLFLSLGLMRLGILVALDKTFKASLVFYPLGRVMLILKLFGFWLLMTLIYLPFAIVLVASSMYIQSHSTDTSAIMLIPVAGIALSVFGLLYVMIRAHFGWAVILDVGKGPWTALCSSFHLTRCNFWRVLGLYLLNLCIIIICIIPVGIGLIWGIPYSLICYGSAYRNLSEGQR